MAFFFIFIFGLIIGSFLNVVILRYNTGKSIVRERSKCFSCGKNLKCHELIPLLSFIIQKGKCKNCGSKISIQYPVVEFITGVIFISVFYKFYYFINFNYSLSYFLSVNFYILFYTVAFLIFFSNLIIITVYDFYHKIIPPFFSNFLIIFGILFALSLFFLNWTSNLAIESRPSVHYFLMDNPDYLGLNFNPFLSHIFSGLIFAFFFFSMSFISKEKWIGYGDSKLALSIGFFLGPYKTFLAFLFSFWSGAIISIALIFLLKNKLSLKSQIPFAPFLALGAFLSFLI